VLRQTCRVFYKDDHSGKSVSYDLFEENSEYFGVPRNKALLKDLKNHYKIGCIYSTSKPHSSLGNSIWAKYRPGQKESVDAIYDFLQKDNPHRTKFSGALLEAKCGAGKTFMGLRIAQRLQVRTLVVTHKDDLAEQWANTAIDLLRIPEYKIGRIKQNTQEYGRDYDVSIASAGTLYSRRDQLIQDMRGQFGLVIFDEMHRYPAKTLSTVMCMSDAMYRMGVSATYRRRDNCEFVWQQHVGNIEHKMTGGQRLTGTYVQVGWSTNLDESAFKNRGGRKVNSAKLITALAENIPYNRWLTDQCVKASKEGRRVLLVSDRVAQLEWIHDQLSRRPDYKKSSGLYIGKTKPEDREKVKKCDVILGSYMMFAEGTDVKELDTLILATPRSDIEQVVGRIQRKCEGKKSLLVVDPVFNLPYCKALGRKRVSWYKKIGFEPKES
jgi:superfamily II DNA or RNA helicase